YQILRGDVVKRLEKLSGQQFDRIYFDPPYDSDLYVPVLSAIASLNLLAPDGELAVEHRPGSTLPEIALTIVREKRYGNTALTFYQAL
ncbi:RsmD family RNA methyltransferase, partial [Pseudanabaenaceae cyanobacterium LEGE 13415]|nr:RsmD family RNA methyltransferase [Pseudanabaenaceae cyanobacterium LEGE 13415]